MSINKKEKKDLAYRLRSQKIADAISSPSPDDISVEADAASDLVAGDLNEVLIALSARIKALEDA